MKMESCKTIALTILPLLISGCAAVYPKQKQNVLEHSVEFNYKHLTEPQITKEVAISKAKVELQRKNLLGDKYAMDAFDATAPDLYEKTINSQPSNELNFIRDNIRSIYERNTILKSKYGSPNFSLQTVTVLDKQDGNFDVHFSYKTGVFSYPIGNPPPFFSSESTFDAVISGKYSTSNGITSGNFSKFSYTLNANAIYGSGNIRPDVIETVFVNEKAIVPSLELFSAAAKKRELDLVRHIVSSVEGKISTRYYKSTFNEYPKFEKKYKIDFATAKARLQRALGGFKYDDAKSTFNFEQNLAKNYNTVMHKFAISLFPDKTDTVVQFSGEYQYIIDKLGGPNNFDSAT